MYRIRINAELNHKPTFINLLLCYAFPHNSTSGASETPYLLAEVGLST